MKNSVHRRWIDKRRQAQANGCYETTDIGCCAALISAGCLLIVLDRTNPRRIVFRVERGKRIDAALIAENYYANKLEVDARQLIDNMRMLKSRLYDV